MPTPETERCERLRSEVEQIVRLERAFDHEDALSSEQREERARLQAAGRAHGQDLLALRRECSAIVLNGVGNVAREVACALPLGQTCALADYLSPDDRWWSAWQGWQPPAHVDKWIKLIACAWTAWNLARRDDDARGGHVVAGVGRRILSSLVPNGPIGRAYRTNTLWQTKTGAFAVLEEIGIYARTQPRSVRAERRLVELQYSEAMCGPSAFELADRGDPRALEIVRRLAPV